MSEAQAMEAVERLGDHLLVVLGVLVIFAMLALGWFMIRGLLDAWRFGEMREHERQQRTRSETTDVWHEASERWREEEDE